MAMDEKDFEKIEALLTRKLSEHIDAKFDAVDAKLEGMSNDFNSKLDSQSQDFHRWLKIQGEEFQQKLDLVVEGHQMLSEKLDRVEGTLSSKIDAVAAGLAAHVADPNAHKGIYRVKEDDSEYQG